MMKRYILLSLLYIGMLAAPVVTIYAGVATVFEWYPETLNKTINYPFYPWGSIFILLSLTLVPVLWPLSIFRLALMRHVDAFDRFAIYWGVILSPISTIVLFASFYKTSGLNIPNTLEGQKFVYIYFSAMTFTTVGYGDVTPAVSSMIFASIEALVGYFQLGLLIAALTTAVNRR